MLAEWSVECSAEDPVLVIPWRNPDGSSAFVDLRTNPYDLDAIPEAEQHPPLMHALRALNAQRSPVFTAKCDAWPLEEQELAQLQMDLDVPPADASSGFASYIDLVWRERAVFASFHQQEQAVQRLVRNATAIDLPLAVLDCVLRPALVDLNGAREGYAVSFYVKALGADPQSAQANWTAALEVVVALLRSKDLAGAAGNKTRAS